MSEGFMWAVGSVTVYCGLVAVIHIFLVPIF
jgi:hypothetical protein